MGDGLAGTVDSAVRRLAMWCCTFQSAAHCRLQAAPHCTAHYCTTALALVDTMHCTILHYSCTLHYVSVSRMCDCHHWSSQLAMTCGWKKPSDPIRLSDQGNTAQYRLMCLNRKSSEKVIRSPRGAAIIPHFTALLLYWTLLCYTLHCPARDHSTPVTVCSS